MKTYIAILRGINVSGKNMIKMSDLKTRLEKEGFSHVHTYIQSGNVIFQHTENKIPSLEEHFKKFLMDNYAADVPLIIKTPEELEITLNTNPFLERNDIDQKYLHVTFLARLPEKEKVEKLAPMDFRPDEFRIDGKSVFVYCPNGYGRTKINNNFFENKLKVTATTRNWKTVNKLCEMVKD